METRRTLTGLRIALIEDDNLLRESLSFFLRVKGCLVETFECAEDALAAVSPGLFDVVISDLLLPGEDGLSLLRRARQASRTVVTVLITAYGTSNLSEEARQVGVDTLLFKPFSTVELESALQRTIDRGRAVSDGLTEVSG
jgi:DNA-binding response OmpR family regulator